MLREKTVRYTTKQYTINKIIKPNTRLKEVCWCACVYTETNKDRKKANQPAGSFGLSFYQSLYK